MSIATRSRAGLMGPADKRRMQIAVLQSAPVALTDGANISVDLADADVRNFTVTLGGNRTLDNPTGQVAGQSGLIIVKQDGTGSRTLSYGSNYKFGGGAPTLTATADAIDAISYFVESDGLLMCAFIGDFKS